MTAAQDGTTLEAQLERTLGLTITALVEWRQHLDDQRRGDELHALKRRIDELEEREANIEAKEEQLELELREAQQRVKAAEEQRLSAEEEAAEERKAMRLQIEDLQRQIADKQRQIDDLTDPDQGVPESVETFKELVVLAREHLQHIAVPESAERDLHHLDAAREAKLWAQKSWNGLRALDEYARNAKLFSGSFREWCEQGEARHSWPATDKKLAMSESRPVMENPKFRKQREFKISTDVKDSGFVVMEAHLKIAEGGGGNIPRIYFYDDSGGRSGKVHIGFIGPHRLVENPSGS